MRADLDLNDLDEVRRRVVDPVLSAMLRPGELVSADLVVADDWPDTDETRWAWKRWPNNPNAARPGDEPDSLYLVIRAIEGEEHTAWLGTLGFYLHDVDDIVERLVSDLNDWICETRFGWGQLRGMDTEPPGPRAEPSGRSVVGLWVGVRTVEVTIDRRPVDPATLGLSDELLADLQAWRDRFEDWATAADAEAQRRSETLQAQPSGFTVTYVDAAKTEEEVAAVRAARDEAHLGSWRRAVAELEPARDALLARLATELGHAYVAPPPARIR
ncbi:hypothetical protein [Sporichthya polymorpha]|uniref:hypothetical protein n=1 Tax=Sporichthya polymorpha TaxID=35751 RepID=UPI00036C80E7|nr:hypothetical protein [Sporichthya polymorpha]